MLSTMISEESVVRKLIKLRCKYAAHLAEEKQRKEFVLKVNEGNKKYSSFINDEKKIIYSLFPPRRNWCHINYLRSTLDSSKRNERKLFYTYIKARKNNSKEVWYIRLKEYVHSILYLINNPGESLPKPHVFVIEKERTETEIICRPVCSFPLKIKIALSLINGVLTRVLDKYFFNCSYAFRIPSESAGQFQHINAVKAIQQYRKVHLTQSLYVAECDMQKFYDTIDHDIIKLRFNLLFRKAKTNNDISSSDYHIFKKWFYNYIDCFDFYSDIYRYNYTDNDHFIWRTIKNKGNLKCKIKWVNMFFKKGRYILRGKKKGVPQGGALSGLVANIVMHYIDKDVLDLIAGDDILYCRFCDDMIIIGTEKCKVEKVFEKYASSVRNSKLFPHENRQISLTKMSEFWDGKTRGPYEWGVKGRNVYPWITFVGFDCNWKGNLRIRKRSLHKEITKQFTVVNDFLKVYSYYGNLPRYSDGTMKNSLVSRLIGMSVGRINLRNYQGNKNIHSWMSAFSILDKNPWSEYQLKLLDQHRNVMINRAVYFMSKLDCPKVYKKSVHESGYTDYIGKAFSYYGQCFDYK